MTKQKIGLIIFIFGVIWAIAWGVVGSVSVSKFAHTYTMEEFNQTVWASDGGLMMLWGLGGVPLGALLSGIGMLFWTQAKTSTILLFGIGGLVAVMLMIVFSFLEHIQLLFGIGGSIILLCFFGILWFWAKKRVKLTGTAAKGADFHIVGYLFLLFAAWFTCGIASEPFLKAFEDQPHVTPFYLIFFFILGWLFLMLGHYYSGKQQE
jgi:hypothetical protein